MARLPRLVLPGHRHVVVQRALDDRPAFADAADRRTYLDALRQALAAVDMRLHAWALTRGEARLLVTPPDTASISRLVQTVGRRYVSAYNRRHGRRGTLWDGRFRCVALEPGAACLDAMVWIDAASDESTETSAAHHLGARRDPWLVDPPEFWALGNTPFERESAYALRLAAGLPPAHAAAVEAALRGGWPIGSVAFAEEAAKASGRPGQPRPRGRPPRRAIAR